MKEADRTSSADLTRVELVNQSPGSADLRRRRFIGSSASTLVAMTGIGAVTNAQSQASASAVPSRTPGVPLGGNSARAAQAELARVCGGGPGESERACDIFSNNSKTPLQSLFGTITPSDLHFERSHSGTPMIDPVAHKLLVHGLSARATVFTMDEIYRMPSMTRTAFIECAGNGWDNWKEAKPDLTVQDTHGLISNSEWTGVPLAFICKQAGVSSVATWMLAEGSDGAGVDRSIPLTEAVMRESMLAYAQNGEPLRPTNGYPLRLLVPGFEGNMQIKWLRRLKFASQPYMTRWETAKYTDLYADGKARKFTLIQGPGSVITTPSGRMELSRGSYEIRGLAWSGHGRAERIDVSLDGGHSWQKARVVSSSLPKAVTRFVLPWEWKGQEALLQSRCSDEHGNQQPTRQQLIGQTGTNAVYHYNAIQTWKVDAAGRVTNVYA